MPALRPASQAGPVRNPREGTSRAKGGIGSGETLCHDIYPARPITTVSLAANTYYMMDGHSSCAPRTVDPRVQFSADAINTGTMLFIVIVYSACCLFRSLENMTRYSLDPENASKCMSTVMIIMCT